MFRTRNKSVSALDCLTILSFVAYIAIVADYIRVDITIMDYVLALSLFGFTDFSGLLNALQLTFLFVVKIRTGYG